MNKLNPNSILTADILDEIKSVLNKFKTNDPNEFIELEIKFGSFDESNNFRSGIQRKTFYRLIENLKELNLYPRISETEDEISGSIRKTTSTSNVTYIKKETLYNYISTDYLFKISISKETKLPVQNNFRGEMKRIKKRRTYALSKEGFKIDITEVTNSRTGRFNYEVEFELLDNSIDLDKIVLRAFKLVNDTFDIYTVDEKREIIKYVNICLESSRGEDKYFDISNLVLPRNIKYKDIIYGGIVGHPDITYNVTHKTDGQRRQLLIHDSGIFLFSTTNDFNKISIYSLSAYFNDNTNISGMTGYILDGELVSKSKRLSGSSGSQYWYLIFDCLSVPKNTEIGTKVTGTRNIQDEPFLTRMENSQLIADIVKNPIIEISTKTFYSLETPIIFFEVETKMFEEEENLPYLQDGFIFTPLEISYTLMKNQNIKKQDRTLSKYPEIVKWKPKEKLTMDLEIIWNNYRGNTSLSLMMSTKKNSRGKTEFVGDWINSFDINMVDMNQKLLDTTSGIIGEFYWDYDRELLVLERIRVDKTKPNSEDIVLDIWEDIHNPIEKDTLTGNSMNLLRRYHNRIKNSLYKVMDKDLTLLDIGSGRGGDVSKWKDFSKVVAVEPNIDNYKELVNRINVFNMQDKVFAINTKGEDTKGITSAVKSFIGTRVDVVSMMLSLSYFWESKQILDKLFQTIISNISEKGKFIFLTIDGNVVENFFNPQLGNGVVLDDIKFGDYFLMKYNSNTHPISVDVFMKDSILNNREWLVKLDDLILLFSKYGFRNTSIYRSDKEKLLSIPEKAFSSMFTYGIFESVTEGKISIYETKTENKKNFPVEVNIYESVTVPNIPNIDIATKSWKEEPVVPFKLLNLKKSRQQETLEPQVVGNIKIMQNRLLLQKEDNMITNEAKNKSNGLSFDGLSFNKLIIPKSFNFTVFPSIKQITSDKIKHKSLDKVNFVSLDKIRIQYFPFEDDFQEIITKNIFRISSINDNSSFFHCMMKAISEEYIKNMDLGKRKQMVREFRRDLCFKLNERINQDEDMTYYENLNKGLFTTLYSKYDEMSIEYLQLKLNSNDFLSEEFLFIASDLVDLDFIICDVMQSKLKNDTRVIFKYITSTLINDINDKPILIMFLKNDHYELIAELNDDNNLICVFDFNDKLVQDIIKKKLE